jgi:putative redox protein
MSKSTKRIGSTPNLVEPGDVVVRGVAVGFAQEVLIGPHRLAADEPAAVGGTDTGPTPYDFLLAALGS